MNPEQTVDATAPVASSLHICYLTSGIYYSCYVTLFWCLCFHSHDFVSKYIFKPRICIHNSDGLRYLLLFVAHPKALSKWSQVRSKEDLLLPYQDKMNVPLLTK